MVSAIKGRERQSKGSSMVSFVTSWYYDPFKWSIVKSIGFAATSIYIARGCKGLELMPNV